MNLGRINNTVTPGNRKGFSLIEVIVAIGILSVGILAVASMQGAAVKNNVFAERRTQAATWATDRVEKLMNLDWNDSLLSDTDGDGQSGLDDTDFDNNPATTDDADHIDSQGNYTIYWNVADNEPIENVKTLRVIVVWSNYGIQGRVVMERLIPRVI